MKRRIYVDTSVIGGCLDIEFRTHSNELFDLFRQGGAILVLSDLTMLELVEAPDEVRAVLDTVAQQHRERVELTGEAAALADRYIRDRVVDRSKLVDAQHIAIATVSHVDVLVSWNFKHVVNLDRIRGYNSVNLRLGHPLLEIRTPREILDHED